MWQNVILVGPMGVGKTTIAKGLSKRLGTDCYDTDCEVERRTGTDIARVFDIEGEAGFRKREKQAVADLCLKKNIILSTGGGVILDEENRRQIMCNGFVVYLRASVSLLVERTRYDTKRPSLRLVKDREGFFIELLEKRDFLYRQVADMVLDTDKQSPKKIIEKIIAVCTKG